MKNITFKSKQELLHRLDEVVELSGFINRLQRIIGSPDDVNVLISSDEVKVHQLNTGAWFHWNVSDPRTAIACLAVSGEYESRETALIMQITKNCRSIVDVGANVGYYSVNIPLMSPSVTRVYAFEPLAEAYEQLCRNIQLNKIDHVVRHFNVAVSNNETSMELFVPKVFGSSATSSVELHPEVANSKVVVDSITLDKLFKNQIIENCDFLKIDVEGGEKFVLEGASELLSVERPVILAEILRKWSLAQGYNANEIILYLRQKGYRSYAIGENLFEINEISDELIETNFLFLNFMNRQHQIIASELEIKE